jgi:hypothetical protein
MKKNPLVAALAALSLAGAAFAGQAVQQQAPQQARHNSTFASTSDLDRALNGNSVAGFLPHNYLNGNSGVWLAGFGQVTASYNSNYLLDSLNHSPRPVPGLYTGGSSFTVAIPHIDLIAGYDAGNVGLVTDINYSIFPVALGNNIDLLDETTVNVREAYMTYKINDMFAVRAGKFNQDFGSYNPTDALISLPAAMENKTNVGVEGVVATHGFHASITGAMVDGASKQSGDVVNNARPNTLILNGGYDMAVGNGTAGIQGSYNNNGVLDADNTDNGRSAAWTIGAHFANDQFVVKGDVLNQRYKSGDKPWIWHGAVDYKLGNQFGHSMVVGAYGDYVKHGDRNLNDLHWILGAKFGYSVNKYANATAYVQHAANMKDSAYKNNTTAMLALTVKV